MCADILEEAENFAWWASLNREVFAEYIFDKMVDLEIGGFTYKVEDYLTREHVMKFWDISFEQIEHWAREIYDLAQQNGLALWMSLGMVIGWIGCAVK